MDPMKRMILPALALTFVAGCGDDPSAPKPTTIRAVPGSEQRIMQIAEGVFPFGQPAVLPDWSPDGERIAYVNAPKGSRVIWSMRADGTDPKQITEYGAVFPAWSPDGSQIAHTITRLGGSWILSAPASGGPSDTLTPPWMRPISADWSDPSKLLVDSGHEGSADIWLVPLDGGDPTRLTSDLADELFPVWSPDMEWIAYASQDSALSEISDIFVMRADGSDRRNLTNGPGYNTAPTWSPDGAWIAFDSNREGNLDIWAVPFAGGESVQLTADPAIDSQPDWSPDGKKIAFVSHRGGSHAVWTVEVETVK